MEEKNAVLERLGIDGEELAAIAEGVAIACRITEPQAVVAVGTYMATFGKAPEKPIDVSTYISTLKTKQIQELSHVEIQLLLELKFLRRKQFPFTAIASKTGRNELCPCGSEKKYKNCCLDAAKAQDVERYTQLNGRMK